MIQSRLYGADFVRATACLLVVAHHLAPRLDGRADVGFMEWFRSFGQFGNFGVAMFFVLSGFLLARPFWQALDRGEAMPSLRVYALRRAARILPGYWLALWVTFVLTITVLGVPLDWILVLRALAGTLLVADWHWLTLFPVEVNGPLWSISFEVTSYLLLPLGFCALFAVGWSGWRARLLWLGVIGVALLAHWAFVTLSPIDNVDRGFEYGLVGGAKAWWPRFNPLGFFNMFAIGALAAGAQVQLARARSPAFDAIALSAAGAAVAWLLAVQLGMPTPDGWGWLDLPYGFPWFVLFVGLFLFAAPQSRMAGPMLDNPAVRYVARISFGIYVWHYVVLYLLGRWLAPDLAGGVVSDPWRFVLLSTLVVGLTMLIAHHSYRYIESPIMRWARGFERDAKSAPTLSPAAG
jgi:peptidoglycan/LPS O-acetylase OafA/YrhL